MTLSTLDTCIVKGDLKLMNDGKIKFEQLENNKNEIAVGEEIVTSHISDKYLQGITIGVISDIKVDSNNLTRSGYLTPVVDFKHLHEVLVITTLKEDVTKEIKAVSYTHLDVYKRQIQRFSCGIWSYIPPGRSALR